MACIVKDNNAIYLTRGDSMSLQVNILVDDEPYTPQQGDSITFALKHTTMNLQKSAYTDTNPLITKSIPTTSLTLTLLPSDTASLGFGQYVYDIQLETSDGEVDTFIAEKPFWLTPEVH